MVKNKIIIGMVLFGSILLVIVIAGDVDINPIEEENKTLIDYTYGIAEVGNENYEVKKVIEDNISLYKIEMPDITVQTPINTICYWGEGDIRRCYQDINMLLTNEKEVLTIEYFSKEFQTSKFKNFKIEKVGKEIIRMSFDYPANHGEEWNITFDDGTTSFKIDPTIDACSVLNLTGKRYVLDADIIDTTIATCMDITANDVILDCQWHKIDAINPSIGDYGIYIYRSQSNATNVSVFNCEINDFSVAAHTQLVDNLTFTNIISKSSNYGISFYDSHNVNLTNISISNLSSIDYPSIHLVSQESVTSNINLTNSKTFDNYYGLTAFVTEPIDYPQNLTFYNNYFNNTHNQGSEACLGTVTDCSDVTTICNDYFEWLPEEGCCDELGCSLDVDQCTGTTSLDCANDLYLVQSVCYMASECAISYYINNPYLWNTSKLLGNRIIGFGNSTGGNYWGNRTGVGYSELCVDENYDGFCDLPYDVKYNRECTKGVNCSDNTDYLPLSDNYYVKCLQDNINFTCGSKDGCTNSTPVNHNLKQDCGYEPKTYTCTIGGCS